MSFEIEFIGESSYKSIFLSKNLTTKERAVVKKIKVSNVNNVNNFIPLREKHILVVEYQTFEQNHINVRMPYLEKFNVNNNNSHYLLSNVLLPLCKGIDYIHSFNILHGSINPNNLFVDDSGYLLISDVYHRFLYLKHNYNMSMNSLYYSSPEILESKPITKSSDLWSLGEIIYYCFNGGSDIIHAKNIKSLYDSVCNIKSIINIKLIPYIFQQTLKKIFSINPIERPSLEEISNQLKKIIYENLTCEDIFMLLDECEEYLNETNAYEKIVNYFFNDNNYFLQLIDRINASVNYRQTYSNVLMNIALKDKEKRVYMLKNLVYNSQTKEYFSMIKLISNNNEIEIEYDKEFSPYNYSIYYENNVYSYILKHSKPNVVIKSCYELSHLLYPFKNLRQLTVSNIKLDNRMEKIFSSIVNRNSQLVDLKCSDLCLTEIELNYLKYSILCMSNLRKLSVESDRISDDVIDIILPYTTSLHNLKEVNLSHNNIKALTNLPPKVYTPSSSSLLMSSLLMPSLPLIGVKSSSFTTSTPSNVQSILSRNETGKNPFQPELLHPIFSLTHLEKLNLEYNQIDDIYLPKLFTLLPTYNLKSINISANSFCDVGFIHFCSLLSRMPRLEDLSFDSNKLSDHSMSSFAQHLISPIGDKSIGNFSYYLSFISKLERLTITDTDMTDDGFFAISEQFSSITNLQKLSVSFRKSTLLNFKEICSSLYNFKYLKQLDFSWNELGDSFISILSQYFRYISNLECLALNDNCIKDVGVSVLSKNLYFLSNLQELYLSRNGIEDNGVLELSKHFSSIQKLKTLDLSINMISDEGVMYISQYSSYLSNLECLSLAFNRKLTNSSTNDFIRMITQLEKLERFNGAVDLPVDISVRLKSGGSGKTKLVTTIHGPHKEPAEYYIDIVNGNQDVHLPFEGEPEAVIFMFSLISSISYSDIINFWCNLLPRYQHAKYILLGTKVDLRKENEENHIRYFDGLRMSRELKCDKYLECDLTMGDGIKVLHIVKDMLFADHADETKKIKKKCIIM